MSYNAAYDNFKDVLTDILVDNTDAILSILYGDEYRIGCTPGTVVDANENPSGELTSDQCNLPPNGTNIINLPLSYFDYDPNGPNPYYNSTVYNPQYYNYIPTKLISNIYEYIDGNIYCVNNPEQAKDATNNAISPKTFSNFTEAKYTADNVRLPYRMAKHVFKYYYTDTYRITEISDALRSVTEYLFNTYLQSDHKLEIYINIFQFVPISQQSLDPCSIMPMIAAMDALAYANNMFEYNDADHPKIYWLPYENNPMFTDQNNFNILPFLQNSDGKSYCSYLDLYYLRNMPAKNNWYDCTDGCAYPFFSMPTSGAQQAGLGMISFLMTNEALKSTNGTYNTYLDISLGHITTNIFEGINVYEDASGTNTISLYDDIIRTYYVIVFLGEQFGYGYTSNIQYGLPGQIYKPYLMTILIDDINYDGTVPTLWTVQDTSMNDQTGSLNLSTKKLFDIWTCADTGWGAPDAYGTPVAPGGTYSYTQNNGEIILETNNTPYYKMYNTYTVYTDPDPKYVYLSPIAPLPKNNFMGPTLEIFSYQLLVAALTRKFDIFKALHRYYYYLLYMQNGAADEGTKMGLANTVTYHNVTNMNPPGADVEEAIPIPATSDFTPTYMNRQRYFYDGTWSMKTADGNTKQHPWNYVSYCAGYQPYANFLTKKFLDGVSPIDLTEPIFYMANPYYKYVGGLYSAADADFTLCTAYKVAATTFTTANGFCEYDDTVVALVANGTVSQLAAYKVGADISITWEFMYNQITETLLAITGGQNQYQQGDENNVLTGLPTASTFQVGLINDGKYLVTQGHDTGSTSTLHPDYIDFTLLRDWQVDIGCFLKGTMILTKRGNVAIETLTSNDMVISFGDIVNNKTHKKEKKKFEPIKWLGKYVKRTPLKKDCPICFTKNSFRPGEPFMDLYLTSNHGVVVNDLLVPAQELVKDPHIYPVYFDEVVYYHLEVAGHQCIAANGVMTETYRDNGNRAEFTCVFKN